ncbi:MAG: TraB/GumN family protein [Spirochaetaceae bacterium]|nr:TraB/GumN family protein [Spirochaetaceae bacterium]
MGQFNIEKISDTRTRIIFGSREIILVGTAHVSSESLVEVKEAIQFEAPDHICVEMDEGRLKNLEEGRRWSGTDLKNVLRKGQGFMMMANLALSSFQRRMGADTGVQPGEEMKAAVDAAREGNIPFSCSDRSIQVTLSRAWRLSGIWSKMKLISSLIASVLSNETATPEEIEELKKSDAMQGMMNELADYLPAVKTVLIDERDQFLSSRIYTAPGKKTIAIVGAAHVPGIIELLRELNEDKRSSSTAEIENVPPRKWIGKALPWIIPAAIIGLFVYGTFRSGFDKVLEMGKIWILANGTLASLGALAALAHPLTILISFVGAPITSLNPTIGVGMVAGLLEYVFRTPRVLDMENLNTDILSFRGWYRNRVTRILLVFFLSSVGSSVGTFIAIPWLTRIAGS